MPLGMFDDGAYTTSRVELSPGDTLIVYTDGVTEALDPWDHEYGTERRSLWPRALVAALLREG